MRILTKIIFNTFCIFLSVNCFASTDNKVACVIGNSDYNVSALNNPVNDAKTVSNVLEKLGFQVNIYLNSNHDQMEKAIRDFGNKLNINSVALFYYAGHAVQHEGHNYLIPIGSIKSIIHPDHLRQKSVDIEYLSGVLKKAKSNINIVILDACRDNPFRSFSRTISRGLVRTNIVEGTILAYSTAPGTIAMDGEGNNSPYTIELVKLMQIPGLPIEQVFKQVRKNVRIKTKGRQSPWYEASIDGDFYFVIGNQNHTQYVSLENPYINNDTQENEYNIKLSEQPQKVEIQNGNLYITYENGEKKHLTNSPRFENFREAILSSDKKRVVALSFYRDMPQHILIINTDGDQKKECELKCDFGAKGLTFCNNNAFMVYIKQLESIDQYSINKVSGIFKITVDEYNFIKKLEFLR